MELWFTEKQTPYLEFSCKVAATLHREKTPYQDLAVIDTFAYGRMLVLDGIVQTTVKDEFIYHEMITHVALNTHPAPREVLIIGGGDGGTLREVVKHPRVERATMVEIDERVIAASREYLPELSVAFDHPKANVVIDDGIKYVAGCRNQYDVIIIDSTDPVGPAQGLFRADFYRNTFEALKEDGLFVAQTESPLFDGELVRRIFSDVRSIFPVARLYITVIPTYPGGLWTFTMGSKRYDPCGIAFEDIPSYETRFYTPAVHRAAFVLPRFVEELLEAR
jgi:spermidine synthase